MLQISTNISSANNRAESLRKTCNNIATLYAASLQCKSHVITKSVSQQTQDIDTVSFCKVNVTDGGQVTGPMFCVCFVIRTIF